MAASSSLLRGCGACLRHVPSLTVPSSSFRLGSKNAQSPQLRDMRFWLVKNSSKPSSWFCSVLMACYRGVLVLGWRRANGIQVGSSSDWHCSIAWLFGGDEGGAHAVYDGNFAYLRPPQRSCFNAQKCLMLGRGRSRMTLLWSFRAALQRTLKRKPPLPGRFCISEVEII